MHSLDPSPRTMNIALYHPQIVHFTIALLITGVGFRLLSLLPIKRLSFLNGAAAALLILGTAAAVLAVRSGDQAHGPVERVPGARAAVQEHERYGEQAHNIFLAVAALELIALAAMGRPKPAQLLRVASAVVGLVGSFYLYEAGEHGGELVYSYAGGVGIRSGEPADVDRLLTAALYHKAHAARDAGSREDAATWFEQLARQRPDDAAAQLLLAESTLRDRGDAAGALARLDAMRIADDDTRSRTNAGMLRADALVAAGQRDSARAVLQALATANPANARVKAKLDSLGR